MNEAAKRLIDHLKLEQLSDNAFRSIHENDGMRQVFGGQLMAQAMLAAMHTVSATKILISFQSTFVSAAKVSELITYDVEQMRESKTFSMRRVVARQGSEICFEANLSFQIETTGLDFAPTMPKVAAAEHSADLQDMMLAYQEIHPEHLGSLDLSQPLPPESIETRSADMARTLQPSETIVDQCFWIRFVDVPNQDQPTQQQILAYASDQAIAHLISQPHGIGGINPRLKMMSLDHSMWFHRELDIRQWHLLVRRCQSITSGRGLVTGEVYSEDGLLIASLSQQALLRLS